MQARDGRRGSVFPVRLTDAERQSLEEMRATSAGPEGLGPWLVWAATEAYENAVLPARSQLLVERPAVIPASAENDQKLILDLCGGSGEWGRPYREAGYVVQVVDMQDGGTDVRDLKPVDLLDFGGFSDVHGILAAPPCTEFSLAKNGQTRHIRAGLEVVSACIRLVAALKPEWWALENPVGLLQAYLGTPVDVWEPYEFGDPWTKRTALWGEFNIPRRGPFVEPTGSAMDRSGSAARAVTPPGFARAFFEANP